MIKSCMFHLKSNPGLPIKLPAIYVSCADANMQAIDAWGNAAGPTDALPCDVTVDCNALSPAQASFSICASGRAYVDGMLQASPCEVMSSVCYVFANSLYHPTLAMTIHQTSARTNITYSLPYC